MRNFLRLVLLALSVILITGCAVQEEQANKLVVPTPETNSGVVSGRLIVPNEETAVPQNIFLSKNLTEGRTDVPPVISFSYQSNPRGVINEDGYFYFSQVPAGTYVITIWTPPNQTQFITDTTGEDYLWVVVKVGETNDLGDIQIP
jgi:hypothetical protein